MPGTPLPRRSAVSLAGLAGVGVVSAGCSPGVPLRPMAAPVAPGAVDEDLVVVEQARAQLARRVAVLQRTRRRHPALGPALRPLLTLHRRHDGVLSAVGAAPVAPAAGRVPRDQDAALAAVVAGERQLQVALVELAVSARSGPLARVLASMAAGTAQRLTLLATTGEAAS